MVRLASFQVILCTTCRKISMSAKFHQDRSKAERRTDGQTDRQRRTNAGTDRQRRTDGGIDRASLAPLLILINSIFGQRCLLSIVN